MQKSTEELTRCSTGRLEEGMENSNAAATRTKSQKIMGTCRKLVHWVVLLDLFLVLSATVFLAFTEFGMFPYKQTGFFCNDPKISFKFMGDTISMGLLLSVTMILPIIMMSVVEYSCYSADDYNSMLNRDGTRLKQIWTWYRHYAAGVVTLCALCQFMKILIGEPRPHFLDTCKPREAANCTNEYISYYTCTNSEYSAWFISDSFRSFPSGHAALSVYMSIFLAWYLQNRLPSWTLFFKPWLQCLIYMWAVTCSLTRICDNRHHWWDVAVGVILGFVFSLFVVMVLCRHFCTKYTNSVVTHVLNETENGQIDFVDK